MKRRIIIALIVFSLLFSLGGIYIGVTIENATVKVDNLIRLHRIELLREHLLLHLKRAQSDLYLKNTRYARSIDTVVNHVQTMDSTLDACFKCHHSPIAAGKLDDLKKRIEQYKTVLSRVFTIRANKERLEAEEDLAFKIGTELISDLDEITKLTNQRLGERTQAALADISRTKSILYLLLGAIPLATLCLSIVFLRGFTKPVDALLTATRQLKTGNLNYRIEGLKDEYGEVAQSFNEMASSLKEHYLKMQWAEQVVILGELTGGLAHEMRNPIAGIKGVMEILAADPSLSERNRDIIPRVMEQIERIDFFLKGLLNYAQPPKPKFLDANVNDLLEATLSLVEKHPLFLSNDSRSIKVVRNYDPRLPKTMVDPIQLQQVFMNLLLNAAEAISGHGTVRVQTSHEDGAPFLRVKVTDDGIGIGKNMMDRIFQPFFTTKAKGTGLGLAITKRLVEQHGGTIHAANNPGGGASFTVDLPIHRESASGA